MAASDDLVLFPEDTTPYLPVGSITVTAPDLLRALASVIHAAATDDARPILASVAIDPRAEAVRLVASDNYRIAMCDVDADVDAAGDWVGPVAAATEDVKRLVAVLKSIPDVVKDSCTARVVLTLGRKDTESLDGPRRLDAFVDDDTPVARLPLRVLDGLYPNVSVLIPAAPEHVATFNGHYLSEAAKFGGAFEPGGMIRQARSGGTDGPFVFTNGRFTEIVMPVKADLVRPAAPSRVEFEGLARAVVEGVVDAVARGELPGTEGITSTVTRDTSRFGGLVGPAESLEQAYARLERQPDFTEVIGTDAGQQLLEELGRQRDIARRTGRRVDVETGELLDGDES